MKKAPSLFLLAALGLLALTPLGCGAWPAPVQSLILEGGETTNLREYDPATTHGSGDKLVFSGLVSLDPRTQPDS